MSDLMGRLDMHDDEIKELKVTVYGVPERSQPGLVGTVAVQSSELKKVRDELSGVRSLLWGILIALVSILGTLLIGGTAVVLLIQ